MKLYRFTSIWIALAICAQQDVIRTSTNEVVVDVVVRDKKGKLVPGLTTQDFTILEDGIPQTVTSVKEIKGSLTAGAEAKTGGNQNGPADVTKRVQLISLVFDRLALDSRRLARQAANDLIKADLAPNVYIAVFASDLHLKIVQPFTNDRALLKMAIEKVAGSSAMTNYSDVNSTIKLAIDSFVQFSSAPIRLMSYAGIGFAGLGFIYALFLAIRAAFSSRGPEGWTTVVVIVLVLGGLQLVMLGVLGEYLWRGAHESRERPLFVVNRSAEPSFHGASEASGDERSIRNVS